MMNKNALLNVCRLALAATFVVSCQDIADDDHYAQPSWLKGNAWQVLENDGNYSLFLKAIELTDYKPLVSGKSVLTVMAPDDSAWQKYLQGLGYTSVEDMNAKAPDELKKTVGYHLMYYAYDWDKLVNFRPNEGDGASDEAKQKEAGLWYKHRTHSQDAMEDMRGKLNSVDTTVTLYHYERFLPVLSHKFFESKGIDAKSNYEYFYPQSTWTGGTNGFNVSNASVTDAEAVVTDNGYLYHVNQVVRPLETIYMTLKQNPNYSDFIGLYDTYAEFSEAATETSERVGKIVYRLTHGVLPDIACEWPVTSYLQMARLERDAYNIFAPSNTAMDNFFRSYWTEEGGYATLADLDPLVLQYFIMQSFATNNEPVFPEEINDGLVQTYFGTPVNINPEDVTDRLFCENGVVYGMDKMDPPAIFSSVVGPAFKDTTYQCFLYTLDKSDIILSLASNKAEFVTLVPTNKQYNQNEPSMRLNTTTAGRLLEVYSDVDGNYATMGTGQARNIVNMHTAQNITELKKSGTQVVETQTAFNYWYVHDGQITTNARFNEQLEPAYTGNPFAAFHEITNAGKPWDNGRSYAYDADDLFVEASGDGLEHLLALGNDRNYEYYLFSQLLQRAGLVTGGKLSSLFFDGERTVVFVPTNEAIRARIADIPGCSSLKIDDSNNITGTLTSTNKSLLANYLRSYFVSSLMNTITSYPYPGGSCKGKFLSLSGEYINISEQSDRLFVGIDGKASVAGNMKYYGLPFAYSDGGMQFIDGILE